MVDILGYSVLITFILFWISDWTFGIYKINKGRIVYFEQIESQFFIKVEIQRLQSNKDYLFDYVNIEVSETDYYNLSRTDYVNVVLHEGYFTSFSYAKPGLV